MMFHNITRQIFIDVALAPAVAGTTDTLTGYTIDTLGYESVVFTVFFGTITGGAVTAIVLQQGDAANAGDMANITNGSVAVAATYDDTGVLSVELHRPTKRYCRVTVTRSIANAVINGGYVLMARGDFLPPAIGAHMSNVKPAVLVSP